MPQRKRKPTSPGRRFQTVADFSDITKTTPERSLTEKKTSTGGRNNYGRKTARHRGGGHKRRYRRIDFRRTKDGMPATVVGIEYDPNRSCHIALVQYEDDTKRYILSPRGLNDGDVVVSANEAVEPKAGNCMPLKYIPTGLTVHNIEFEPGKGGAICRSAGAAALLIASDGDGLSLSKRRITLSTSGVVPEIYRTGEEIGVMLAISLHAVRDELRNELVPINKKYPLEKLMEACRAYPGLSNARRITFEYVMLKGVNDSLEDARDLVKLLKGVPAKINLIPFNPWPGSAYECSDWEQIEKFADFVNQAGYASPIRTPRGRDILAACGQLKSESERMRKSERLALKSMMIAGHGAE